MILKYRLLLFSLFFILFTYSQGHRNSFNIEDSISTYLYNDPDKSIKFLHQYIKINEEEENTGNLILANSTLAVAFEIKNEIDSSFYYYYKNLNIAKKPIDIMRTKSNLASLLAGQGKNDEALKIYYEILKLDNGKHPDFIESIKVSIASLKNKIRANTKNLRELEENYSKNNKLNALSLRFSRKALIEAYIDEKLFKKALVLIDIGRSEATKDNDCEFVYYMNILKSKVHIQQKKLIIAIQDIDRASICAIQLENQLFINEIDLLVAKIQYLNKDYLKAFNSLERVDTNNLIISTNQLTEFYKLRADTFQRLDSSKQSAENYQKYINLKNKLSESKLETIETIHDFDLSEQASAISNTYETELNQEIGEKEKYRNSIWYWAGFSLVLILLVIGVILYSLKKSKINQERFETLLQKINTFEEKMAKSKAADPSTTEKKNVIPKFISLENKKETNSSYSIDDKKVEEILIKIQKLEDKLYYLRQDCTLHNMAKKLKTNTSYLSKIINTHLNKSFSNYINELRINYAILELKRNKRMRSYSVQGIAEELGYKNADAFSRYFKAETGISPSIYIKKIKEAKSTQNSD